MAPFQPVRRSLRNLRRGTQIAFFLLWLGLFYLTRDRFTGFVPPDLFLITDPLAAALTMGAARTVVPVLFWSLILVALTLVLGRFFCGWVCPLGFLIDVAAHLFGTTTKRRLSADTHKWLQHLKYYLLAIMVFAALMSAQWIYLLDPLVLLFRGAAAGLYPMGAALLHAPLSGHTGLTYYGIAFAPALLLITVIALTAITPRFYCRYLCPLGAFYGLLSRAPLLRRRVTGCDACTAKDKIKECHAGCRMGAVPSNPHLTQNHECIRCMSGRSFCHNGSIHFDWVRGASKKDLPVNLGRRAFVVNSAAGAGLAPLVSLSVYHRGEPNNTIRPPQVINEEAFFDACVRCAMCVQACPTQTLQLTHLEAGVGGLWTPAITPSLAGCKADCNDCSVVCPTEAIPDFGPDLLSKWSVKMGTVDLERGRCVCYTERRRCAECIKVCPTEAFVIAHGPRRPVSVDYFRCIGCGLCEKACREIVHGEPALKTFSRGRGESSAF